MSSTVKSQPISRRERLRREREERILEAAAAVFARKGFHQATVREIAESADVADGTIYNYFTDKRDLLVAMTRHVIADSATDALEQLQGADTRGFLTALLSERFALLERNPDFLRAMLAEMWTDEAFREQYMGKVIAPLLRLMEGYLQAHVEAGTVRPLNTSIVIRAMAGSFLIFVLLSQPGYGGLEPDVSREELVKELVDFYLLGLQPHPEWERGE